MLALFKYYSKWKFLLPFSTSYLHRKKKLAAGSETISMGRPSDRGLRKNYMNEKYMSHNFINDTFSHHS